MISAFGVEHGVISKARANYGDSMVAHEGNDQEWKRRSKGLSAMADHLDKLHSASTLRREPHPASIAIRSRIKTSEIAHQKKLKEINKAFKKIKARLEEANYKSQDRNPNERTQHLSERLRENYAQWRVHQGSGQNLRRKPSPSQLEQLRGDKEGAKGMVTGIGNMTRRAGRYLP